MNETSMEKEVLRAKTSYVANLKHCKGNVESPIQEHDTLALEEQQNAIAEAIVEVRNKKTAQCGDERCYVCSASEVDKKFWEIVTAEGYESTDYEPTYQLFGGLFVSATFAAQLAGLAIVSREDTKSFDDAFKTISSILNTSYEDSGHTTDHSFESDDTGCGFEMGMTAALVMTLEDQDLLDSTLEVVAVLSGYSSYAALPEIDKKLIHEVVENAAKGLEMTEYFKNDPVAHRDSLKTKYDGKNLAVLRSAEDATHGHYAKALVVVEDLNHTIDQRKLAQQGNDSFVYHRGFAGQIADVLGGTTLEKRKMQLAYDLSSVVIANKLFGKNMPVFAVPVQDKNFAVVV